MQIDGLERRERLVQPHCPAPPGCMLWMATAPAQPDRGIVPVVSHSNLLAVFTQGSRACAARRGCQDGSCWGARRGLGAGSGAA